MTQADTGRGLVPLVARSYTHPALDGRTVVRLVRQPLLAAEDLAAAVVGLEPVGEQAAGMVPVKAVGFPAWAIINDPANARHALNLVGDLRRAARLARTKPGAAAALIDGLAVTLGNSAPHFLPSLLEEAARVFLAVDNPVTASKYFSKAREAERVHNLAIDEERHRAVLLEFALAGALSAKELTNESKSLAGRADPADALRSFVRLNVDRARGGLAPYASLAADVRRLVKAAGTDQADVERELAGELLAAPVIAAAPAGFWTSYAPALAAASRADAQVRDRLLAVIPYYISFGEWVDLLEQAGAADALRAGDVDVASWAESVLWFTRPWADGVSTSVVAVSRVLRRCPSLAGARVRFPGGRSASVELLDAVLSCGAEIVPDDGWSCALDLSEWALTSARGDLTALAAHVHASAAAVRGLEHALHRLPVLLQHGGSRKLFVRWVRSRDVETLPLLQDAWRKLGRALTPESYAIAAEEFDAFFARADGAELLASTLREGLLTELTWPRWEECEKQLQPRKDGVHGHEAWPAVGMAYRGRVLFLDGDAVLADEVFTPVGRSVQWEDWRYTLVDGVAACLWRPDPYNWALGWSDAPTAAHEVGHHRWPKLFDACSYPVEGGRLCRDGVQRVGDDRALFVTSRNVWAEDGRYWTCLDGDTELDPGSGRLGRASLPTALAHLVEPWLRQGYAIETATWRPSVPTTADSLVSTANGRHAWVMLTHAEQPPVFLDADGQRVEIARAGTYVGRVRRPGGGHWLIDGDGRLCSSTGAPLATALTHDGQKHSLHRLPLAGWHQLRVRDAATSERMRAVQAADVAGLLDPEARRDAAAALLPGADPVLLHAIVQVAGAVAALAREVGTRSERVAGRAQRAREQHQRPATPPQVAPTDAFASWKSSSDAFSWLGTSAVSRGYALRVGDAVGSGDLRVFQNGHGFIPAARPEFLLASALAPMLPQNAVQGAAALCRALVDAGLATPKTAVFTWGARTKDPAAAGPGSFIVDLDGAQYAIAPQGEVPASVAGRPTVTGLAARLDPQQVLAGFERLVADGPPAWNKEAPKRLAELTGWTVAAAALLLAGLPGLKNWQNNFLPPEVRTLLGLKVGETKLAREFLVDQPPQLLIDMLASGAHDPVKAVTDGLDVEAMAAVVRPAGSTDLMADLRMPGEGWSRDPLVSHPDLVADVAAALALDADAARYWLQLLALPDPTDANVQRWNGWTKAARTAAAAPLLAAGLVVEAKRVRAGRTVFLPGGWMEARAPHLPMEVWKARLSSLANEPTVTPLLGAVVPDAPYARVFADAWERYASGDVPGYVELRTERYRRR